MKALNIALIVCLFAGFSGLAANPNGCQKEAALVTQRVFAQEKRDAGSQSKAENFVAGFCGHTCAECVNPWIPGFYVDLDTTQIPAQSLCKKLGGTINLSTKTPCNNLPKTTLQQAITLNGEL